MADIPKGWQEVRLGDFSYLVIDKVDMSSLTVENYISTDNMNNDFGGVIVASKLPEQKSATDFKKGDILFSNIRTYFKKVWQATFDGGCNADVLVFRSKNPEQISNDFLYRILTDKKFTDYTVATSKGVKMPRGDKVAMLNYKTTIPPLTEQKRIADVLSSLDDKIENNRKMNETLENMAQAMFKSWFVDFEPTHELMKFENGDSQYKTKNDIAKSLYMDTQTLDLFPNKFDDNGLPMGWKSKKFELLIDGIKTGKRYDTNTSSEKGNIPVLDQGRSGLIGYHNDEAGVNASFEKPVATFANHTCYRRLIYYPFSTIQNIFVYYGKSVSTIWLHYASLDAIQFTEYKGHMPEFKSKTAVVPNNDLTNEYEKIVIPLLHQIWSNEQEIQTLKKTRDTLLPKLISGEIRI